MGITTEVTVELKNTWLSKEVEALDINDVFQEKGLQSYTNSPVIQEVFYEEVILQTGQVQELNFNSLSQLMFTEFVSKSFAYLHTLSIINIDASGTLQIDAIGAGYMQAPLGNPAAFIPLGPRGAFHISTVSGINAVTEGLLDIHNTGIIPVTYQLFAAGTI